MLVDLGPGAFVRLGETGLSSDQLDTVLLTHLHIDHSGDLPAFVKSQDLKAGSTLHLRIVGPSERGPYPSTSAFVRRLFGAEGAFAYLPGFRQPLDLTTTDLAAELEAPPQPVEGALPLRVTRVAVDHGDVPALAYRIDHAGRSLVISGDLASKHTRLVELAHGADVLVEEGIERGRVTRCSSKGSRHQASHTLRTWSATKARLPSSTRAATSTSTCASHGNRS